MLHGYHHDEPSGRATYCRFLPQDEAKKILHPVGVSTVANVDSVPEIVALLRKLLHAWQRGDWLIHPCSTACQADSAEYQTCSVVWLPQRRPASDPFIPGLVEISCSLQREINNREWKRIQRESFFLEDIR
jgi:hypothetical protein